MRPTSFLWEATRWRNSTGHEGGPTRALLGYSIGLRGDEGPLVAINDAAPLKSRVLPLEKSKPAHLQPIEMGGFDPAVRRGSGCFGEGIVLQVIRNCANVFLLRRIYTPHTGCRNTRARVRNVFTRGCEGVSAGEMMVCEKRAREGERSNCQAAS